MTDQTKLKPKAAAKAPAKKKAPARKIVTKKASKAAAAPKTNAHIEAGVATDAVRRLMNTNRPTRVMLKDKIKADQITADKRTGLYALRDCYGDKPFEARGLDNGILRDLTAAGLISLSGGQRVDDSGKFYMVDGEKPVTVKITAAGLSYGKA